MSAKLFEPQWTDIDLERGVAIVIAKGGRGKAVFLSTEARSILARYPRAGPYVFDSKNARKIFKAGMGKAGIENFTWHDLRHAHATWLRHGGAPPEVVQRSLGRTKITTTHACR